MTRRVISSQVLAQGRLRIQARIDQQEPRERVVVLNCERGRRGVAERQQVPARDREAAAQFVETEPHVVAERLEGDVLGLARALPRPARIDQQRAVPARCERTHELHERTP
jgi:hypothetical protein